MEISIAFLSHVDINLYLFRLPIMLKVKNLGWKVYAICPRGSVSERFKDFGIEHIEFDIDRKSLNSFKEIKTIYELYKILKSLKVDILHTFTYKPNIYGTIAGRLARIPIIVNLIEGLGSLYIEETFSAKVVRNMIELFSTFSFKISDKVIVINPDDMEYLIRKGVLPVSKAILIKSVGIDTEEFNSYNIDKSYVEKLKKNIKIKENAIVVLMISRLLVHKGVLEYLKAAEILKKKYNNLDFLLVGDFDPGNPYNISEEVLHKYINKGIIKFLGWRNDIKELLELCDIFVLPSYREGIPRTLLEAVFMEKPIVTTNTIGCKEVVENGKNGYLVPIKDVEALAKAIEKLAVDRELREKFGKYSRQKAISEFYIGKIADLYVKLYNSLLKSKNIYYDG